MIWKCIPWLDRYEISDVGEVRMAKVKGGYRHLKGEVDKDGYRRFNIKGIHYLAHRLVFAIFVDELRDGFVICHKDGNKSNNAPDNLLQSTQRDNISHKKNHGTWQAGEKHPRNKVTNDKVRKVIAAVKECKRSTTGRMKRGEAERIASQIGVSIHLVYSISCGKRGAPCG